MIWYFRDADLFMIYTQSDESAYFGYNRKFIIEVQLIIEAVIIKIYIRLWKRAFVSFVYQPLYTIKICLDPTAEMA